MADLRLIVAGKRYGGWKRVRVMRSIESMSGSFELEVSDRWGGQEIPWPILEEDACRVEIDNEIVIAGHVDRRSVSLTAEDRTLSYSGRDYTAALVDCSANLERWTFRNATILDLARKVCEPFGIGVSVQGGIDLGPKIRKLVVSPGDAASAVLERAALSAGVLLVSDGNGGLLITRSGSARTDPIVEGQNLLSASVDYDGAERFATYRVVTQVGGTDDASGEVTRVRAEATDEGVRRTERMLIIRPESGVTKDYARKRADWEARNRAARAETVMATVLGWRQPRAGGLWPVNALAPIHAPSIGVRGELLISEVEFLIGEEGEVTQLKLVRPDAFEPEPEAVVKGSNENWKIGPKDHREHPEIDLAWRGIKSLFHKEEE